MDRVKQLRIKNKMSQKELAEYLGVSEATYSKKENRKLRFSIKEAKKMADLYGESIENIFFAR